MINSISIRSKLVSVVTLILLSGFFANNFLNYQVSKGALRTSVLENELPLSSNNIYSEIQADLLRPIFISSLMANDVFVHDWTQDGEKDPGQMIRYLKEIHDKYTTFTSYFISAKTLRYYHFSGADDYLDEKNPEDSWFFAAQNATEPYSVNVDFNYQQGHNITIFINYRVVDAKGEFLGVTGVGLNMESVSKLVASYQKNFRRNVYFVDQEGLIRVHASSIHEGKTNIKDQPGLGAISSDILKHERGSYSYDIKGDSILLTTRFIPELKWYLFIELPESQALQDMQAGFLRNLVVAPLVILVTILMIVYTINIFQRRLERMAVTDRLTGLKNRDYFDATLTQAIKQFKRDHKPFALLMIDIDHFKKINDQMGHLVGDVAIRQTADVLSKVARESDILCRWGGEEFTVLAENCTIGDVHRLSDAIHQAMLDETFFPANPDHKVTLSIGMTEALENDDAKSLLGRADQALFSAKNNGRNRTEIL